MFRTFPSGEKKGRSKYCSVQCRNAAYGGTHSGRDSPTFKHGKFGTSIYRIWACMKSRCHTATSPAYKWYGARGISVCERWRFSFENFYFDMGDRPIGLTLDRIDNNGNYEKSNCRWATPKIQARNSRNAKKLEHNGLFLCLPDWAELVGISVYTLKTRLKRGWKLSNALTQKPTR